MPTILQIRRHLASIVNAATPAQGEFAYKTDTKELSIGDGVTLAGNKLISVGDIANTAQAKAGTAGVLPDAAGTHAAIRELMVGTVSQSGGIPTGAIIESGSNANGYYIKYADGTMICTHAATINTVCTTTAGAALGFYASVFWTLPIVFSTITYANVGGKRNGFTTFTTLSTKGPTTVSAFHQSNLSFTDDIDYCFCAIGRWF